MTLTNAVIFISLALLVWFSYYPIKYLIYLLRLKPHREIASSFWQDEFMQTIGAVKKLALNQQKEIAGKVFSKMYVYEFISQTNDSNMKYQTLVSIAEKAKEERHDALARGANDYNDPDWATAAIIESWAVAKAGAFNGKLSHLVADSIEKQLNEFLDAHAVRHS